MSLFRIAAFVCFLLAAFAAFGWGINWQLSTVIGLIAAGLGFWIASTLDTSVRL